MSFRLEKVFALIYDDHEIGSFGIEPITHDEIYSERVGGDVRRKITTLKEFSKEKRSSLAGILYVLPLILFVRR